MKGSSAPIRNTKRGNKPWMLDLRYVGGRREFYATKGEAETVREKKLIEVQNFGTPALSLSNEDRLMLLQAKARAAALGTTISQVFDFYAKHHHAAQEITIADAVDTIYEMKRSTNKRSRSSEQFRYTLENLSRSTEKKMLHEVAREDVERWLFGNGWAPETIRTKLIDVQTFFRAALVRGWVTMNPTDGIERIERDDKPPGILTVEQASALMQSTGGLHAPFCGFLALALFCGIRPEEIEKMEAKDVNIDRGFAEVRAEVSKTRQRRLVDLSENAKAWLRKGLVLPPVNYRGRLNNSRKAIGFEGYRKERVDGAEVWIKVPGLKWPHDAMRHSFASYHLAMHGSADRTATQMGHRSTEMLFRHYRELVTKSEAERFWSIFP